MTGSGQAEEVRGCVSAPHHLAAQAGQAVLRDGGNAVEATIAMAACLAVVYPHMTGIGGDGFWLISRPGEPVAAIDASGAAAAATSLALYAGQDSIPWRGPSAAITVAGTVSGWSTALTRHPGTLDRSRLLRDAIAHAQSGVAITAGGAAIAQAKSRELTPQPGAYRSIFEPDGKPLAEGDILRQPALADTLQNLAENGFDSYYRGTLARDIAADLGELGSPLTQSDLAAHKAEMVDPLCAHIADAELFNLPFPTQGLASLLILTLFERLTKGEGAREGEGADSFAHIHSLVEATKQAFRIRDEHTGDRHFAKFAAQALLDDPGALDALAASIDPHAAAPWPHPSAPGDTTWFGAADSDGCVVSAIQSTYFEFGSGLVLPRTGITWQNRGAGFSLEVGSPNQLAPGRRPFTTLNPALVRFADGRVLAYGTMGGEGQPQTQAALFTRYNNYGQDLTAAIAAPRWLLGRTWGEDTTRLRIEEGFPPEIYAQMIAAGHDVERVPLHSSLMGHAGAVVRHPDGRTQGASDPRSDGAALSC